MRARDADEPSLAGRGRVRDDLLHALGNDIDGSGGDQLRMVWFDGGDRLRHGQAVHDRRPVRGADVRGVVPPFDGDPGGEDRPGQRIGPAGVARGHDGARGLRMERSTSAGGTADTQDVDARPRRDRAARAGRRKALTDIRRGAGHDAATRAVAHSPIQASAADALAAMFVARSPSHR